MSHMYRYVPKVWIYLVYRDEGGLERALGLGRDPRQVPPLSVLPVQQCRVLRDAVIPDHHGALLPFYASLEVGTEADVLVQELQDSVTLLFLQADDFAGNLTKNSRQYSVCFFVFAHHFSETHIAGSRIAPSRR